VNGGRRPVATLIALVGVLSLLAWTPEPTDASWADTETARGSVASGTVQPPTGLRCTGSGLLQPIGLAWTAPATGLAVSGYAWTVTGGLASSGTLPATATSLTLTSALLGVGSGTFTIRAQGPGGWVSAPRTATVSFTTGLISACSVP